MNRLSLVSIPLAAALAVVTFDLPPLQAASERLAPSVIFVADDGTQTALGASRGRVVLLDIWASWCEPCRKAFPVLDQLYRDYKDRGLDVFAVNVDEHKKDANRFLAGRAHAMPVFFDPQGRTPEAFKVQAMPTSFLIDRRGTIRFAHQGYSEHVLQSYKAEIEQLIREMP
jgi:thiol-disulfide isomerase/thioredoxin